MNISSLHMSQSSIGLNSSLNRLAQNTSRAATDPKQYEGFTVKVGAQSSPDGILGGVLSQQDYDKFMDIVKDVNVMDASYDEMWNVGRRLREAGLLPDSERSDHAVGFTLGSVEFGADGNGINTDKKYNQLEYQRTTLPGYAGSLYNDTRPSAIDGFKLVAAIANASPKTGETVAKEAFSAQERDAAGTLALAKANTAALALGKPLVQLSSRGQQLARDEAQLALIPGLEKKDKDEDGTDEIARLARLLESAKIQRNLDKQDKQAEKLDGKPE